MNIDLEVLGHFCTFLAILFMGGAVSLLVIDFLKHGWRP